MEQNAYFNKKVFAKTLGSDKPRNKEILDYCNTNDWFRNFFSLGNTKIKSALDLYQKIGDSGKYVTVPKHQLRFIDSFKFMASSLDKLSGNLDKQAFTNTSRYYDGKQLDLLLRKGVYPYDYMDSLKRLDEILLPPKKAFYSRLSGEGISDEDYEHAQKVWKEFGMMSLRSYHDLYNKSDVLLLADVFENLRDVCSKNYGLDPAWYYTAPGLAWDAALKITEVELELLSDPDMLLMIEKGIRGGISMISNRHGKANNSYMEDEYDDKRATHYNFWQAISVFMFQGECTVNLNNLFSKPSTPILTWTNPRQSFLGNYDYASHFTYDNSSVSVRFHFLVCCSITFRCIVVDSGNMLFIQVKGTHG